MGTWGRGDVGTRGRGDVGKRGRGDARTSELGDARGFEDVINRLRNKKLLINHRFSLNFFIRETNSSLKTIFINWLTLQSRSISL